MFWLRRNWLFIVVIIVLLGIVGCIATTNPATGQKLYVIDPNSDFAKFMVWEANAVPTVTPLAVGATSILFPIATPIVAAILGLLGGLGGAWKAMSSKLTTANTSVAQISNVLEASVVALQHYKDTNPDGWKEISDKLAGALPKETKQTINGALESIQTLLRL